MPISSHILISRLTWLCLCLMALPSFSWAANSATIDSYQKGNALYEAGKYQQAGKKYLDSFEQGLHSEELFYNLGNSFFKQENYGEASLWYRRALVLNPHMPEPRQNLRALKNRVGLLEFENKGYLKLLSHFRDNELISTLTLCIWIALLSLAAALWVNKLRPWRALLISVSILFALISVASILALKRYRQEVSPDNRAVITSANAVAQTAPVPDAKTVIELPPGSEVRIVTDSGPWQYIDIPGGIRGWVRSEALNLLWPPQATQTLPDKSNQPAG
ncbi:MAG: tetratricopeptide repeat protein [Verrucomicrobiales bacterium]|nr:tetratricopeptide repeat protein [Verrucomicrobiales bacterium]